MRYTLSPTNGKTRCPNQRPFLKRIPHGHEFPLPRLILSLIGHFLHALKDMVGSVGRLYWLGWYQQEVLTFAQARAWVYLVRWMGWGWYSQLFWNSFRPGKSVGDFIASKSSGVFSVWKLGPDAKESRLQNVGQEGMWMWGRKKKGPLPLSYLTRRTVIHILSTFVLHFNWCLREESHFYSVGLA